MKALIHARFIIFVGVLLISLVLFVRLSPAAAEGFLLSPFPADGNIVQPMPTALHLPANNAPRMSNGLSYVFFPLVFGGSPYPNMIYIPAGNFQMGCDPSIDVCSGFITSEDENPIHTVYLDGYYIDKYDVTNARYAACVAAGVCIPPFYTVPPGDPETFHRIDNPAFADYPVTDINWYYAKTFCAWEGKRLPTEAEWEKAARGSLDTRRYPWGNTPPDCTIDNFRIATTVLCVGDTSRVGTYLTNVSPYGVMDMSGNVWNWVNDMYYHYYYSISPSVNPQGPGPDLGTGRVIRGGSWYSTNTYGRLTYRGKGIDPFTLWSFLGFRCVRSF